MELAYNNANRGGKFFLLKADGSITICISMLSEEAISSLQLADIVRCHRLVTGAQREPLWRHMIDSHQPTSQSALGTQKP